MNDIEKLIGPGRTIIVEDDRFTNQIVITVTEKESGKHARVTFSMFEVFSTDVNIMKYYVEKCVDMLEEMKNAES